MKKLAVALALLVAVAGVTVFGQNTLKEIWSFHSVLRSAPVDCSPTYEGDTYFNSANNKYYVCNGAEWYAYSGSASPDGNPVIGVGAGAAQTSTSVDNVLAGNEAGLVIAGAGTDNVCLGDVSCATLTTGDNNVCLGAGNCPALVTGNRNTSVGQGTGPATFSDTVTIGQEMTAKASYAMNIGTGAHDWIYSPGETAKVLVDATATSILDISVADDTTGGAVIIYTVTAAEADEYQSETGAVYLSWENDSGTESCSIGEIGTTVLAGGGAMAVTNACTVGLTDEIRWTFTADSNMGAPATLLHLYYTVFLLGPNAAITPA